MDAMKAAKKIWLGIGVFVVAGGTAAGTAQAPAASQALERPATLGTPRVGELKGGTALDGALRDRSFRIAQGGEGGEGGQGGEGGEGGINIENADSDPVEYRVALQVIAAHYYAGMAAYESKEMEAGAQMFAHGLSEIYVEMEDIFKRRGVTGLGKALEAAVEAASSKAPAAEVRRRVDAVLRSLADAEKAGPKPTERALVTQARLVAELIDRTAAQYSVSINAKALEPYLDGLGFAIAARKEADKLLPGLRKADRKKAAAFETALKLAGQAYPGIRKPSPPKVQPGQLLAAASSAKLAVSNWK
jgi:hypothetical protein